MKIYNNAIEIELDVTKNAPEIIYKYRSWSDEYHKKLLTDRLIWLAHPSSLNDKHDLRPPLVFDEREIETEAFLRKLIGTVPNGSAMSRAERIILAMRQLDIIKTGPPEKFFRASYKDWISSSHYDNFGLFSTSTNEVNATMWAHYSDNHKGYCLGFKTIELYKELNCTFGKVEYTNEPYSFSFINEDNSGKELFMKTEDWKYENEFRFLTLAISRGRERAFTYTSKCVAEVILGIDMPDKDQQEIVTLISSTYGPEVSIFKLKINVGSYGYLKIKLN